MSPRRVRILCFDSSGAVLLMKWRDVVSGQALWEPPGGGIEPGETSRDAAFRELYEETGLAVELEEASVLVERDYSWLGEHYMHLEEFFRAKVVLSESELAGIGMARPTDEELATFLEWRFVQKERLDDLDGALEPPSLPSVIDRLAR